MAREDETEETKDSNVESLEDFLQRSQKRAAARGEDSDDEEALLEAMDEREGRSTESLTVKVVPEQPDEFTCQGCFLVKHRTQLKNRRKQLCNDCA